MSGRETYAKLCYKFAKIPVVVMFSAISGSEDFNWLMLIFMSDET